MEAQEVKDQILSRLHRVKGNGKQYRAKCPVRDHSSGDSTLSLLFNDDGRILIHCHAGCEVNDVLESIGLSLSDLYPDGAIQHFMASAQRKPVKSNRQQLDETILLIASEKRSRGERLTPSEIAEERQAFRRLRK
jgi:hypothetical protein